MTLTLNDRVEFDCPFEIHADGSVTDWHDMYAPDLCDDELEGDGWSLWTHGYSGQYGYAGPIMHNSEFIGGGLERDLLATPGVYVVLASGYSCQEWHGDEPDDECDGDHREGWAIARRVDS